MCQLFALSSSAPTSVTFSFTGFSARGGHTGEHVDGWGIAFHDQAGCRVFIDEKRASDSPLAEFLRNHPIRSRNVLAHIRKATQGPVQLANCHPFMREWQGRQVRAHMTDLARELGSLRTSDGIAPWVRLHYVYPYPHVDDVIPLMAEGYLTPYLDIPFQHAAPNVLKAMKRPANEAKVLERIRNWRAIAPDIAIRSSFVIGFPGETESDFEYLLDWLEEAQLDRVGAFRFEPVDGAQANNLPNPVPEEVKEERFQRIMAKTAAISAAKLAAKVGRNIPVIIDEIGDMDEDNSIGATGRSQADAPEIDGHVYLRDVPATLKAGDVVMVNIEDADEHDLFGAVA